MKNGEKKILSRVNAEMHDLLDLLPGSSLDPV
jgi:hypothetical protein